LPQSEAVALPLLFSFTLFPTNYRRRPLTAYFLASRIEPRFRRAELGVAIGCVNKRFIKAMHRCVTCSWNLPNKVSRTLATCANALAAIPWQRIFTDGSFGRVSLA